MPDFFAAVAANDVAAVRAQLDADASLVGSGAACPDLKGTPLPLAHAARFGHADVCQLLLERGAEIDAAADPERIETPINIAAWFGHAAAVDLLLQRDAALFVHYTPAHWAYHGRPKPSRHQHVIDQLRRYWLTRPELAGAQDVHTQSDGFAITRVTVKTLPAIRAAWMTSPLLTPAEIGGWYGPNYEQFDQALTRSNQAPIGAAVWRYRIVNEQPPRFFIDVAWPVREGTTLNDSKFTVGELPSFQCASMFLLGTWKNMGEAWQSIREQAAARGLRLGREGREVYHFSVGPESADCITEVQITVADG